MLSIKNIQQLVDLVTSPVNGIALHQGELHPDDRRPAGVIRHFGKQSIIFFVHFRDVRGMVDKFVETHHDEGKIGMVACMKWFTMNEPRRGLSQIEISKNHCTGV